MRQAADFSEAEAGERDVTLPDDVMRTKSLILHPVSVEEAVEELELVPPPPSPPPFSPARPLRL